MLKNVLADWARRQNAARADTSLSGKTCDVDIRFDGDVATVDFGAGSFFVKSTLPAGPRTDCNFAIFGLLALSLTYGTKFRVRAPVTGDMQDLLDNLSYCFEIWQIPGLFAPDIELLSVSNERLEPQTDDKIICLSGGIDSTCGAVAAVAQHQFTHGLLIAGADYPSSKAQGYVELRGMVGALADRLGLGLVEVETDLRKFNYDWAFLHGLNLGMCLNFVAPHFAGGGIGLDNSAAQDLVRHPWGNTDALARAMSRTGFPITRFGASQDRVQKLRVIAEFGGPEILRDLSVCWENPDRGSNCGTCTKCIQTRLNFVCAGLDDGLAFDTSRPLIDLIDQLPTPKKLRALRGTFLRTSEFMRHLPDGDLKDGLRSYYKRLAGRVKRHNSI